MKLFQRPAPSERFNIKIAVIAHIRHPIAEPFMGGMEAHCHSLVRALQTEGHSAVLFSAGKCDLPNSVSICEDAYEAVYPWADWRGTPALAGFQKNVFAKAWNLICGEGFDVVHNNSLYPDLMRWAARDDIPMLTSQHVPPFSIMRDAVRIAAADPCQRVSVTSHHQRPLWGESLSQSLDVVHNGVDTDAWRPAKERHDRLMWFGRITPTKGLFEAVDAAHKAGAKLDIVGTIEDKGYFRDLILPRLNKRIVYRGHLSGKALRQQVASARATVVTPMWDEPFGLVAVEALASGVPVIAFDRGALREVVGDCGRLVSAGSVDTLASAMRNPPQISSERCRQRAINHFSRAAMVNGYADCYRAAIRGKSRQAVLESDSKLSALISCFCDAACEELDGCDKQPSGC